MLSRRGHLRPFHANYPHACLELVALVAQSLFLPVKESTRGFGDLGSQKLGGSFPHSLLRTSKVLQHVILRVFLFVGGQITENN